MRRLLALAIGLLGAAAAAAPALPADVAAFVGKRDTCDHFRGEEPYDAARAREIAAALAETCTGTDAALAALRRKYRADPEVRQALAGYEDRIE